MLAVPGNEKVHKKGKPDRLNRELCLSRLTVCRKTGVGYNIFSGKLKRFPDNRGGIPHDS